MIRKILMLARLSSIIHLIYPETNGKGKIKVSWYDGGLLPQRPDELLPEEAFGNWDGGVIVYWHKRKITDGLLWR